MKTDKMVSEIEKRMAAVAKERDRLDNLIANVKGLRENCDEAYNHLECARDALSEMV